MLMQLIYNHSAAGAMFDSMAIRRYTRLLDTTSQVQYAACCRTVPTSTRPMRYVHVYVLTIVIIS